MSVCTCWEVDVMGDGAATTVPSTSTTDSFGTEAMYLIISFGVALP